ncbi:hypothetical protein K505DRAFT_228251 [Melanomma pulvis-pyrius CBS 109.77]|uniref:Phosphoglycerate mutase-like protein n=1 Tax=Melanomma pulvis-pyrius CBS 109.77 TaxID=1314802 RepID=A0A6A6XVW5_9PLEO|nr:hypothetical protein K505DRAFT_228251 [Melanomma pulvis-pyrius CBS 109.77]
MPKGPDVVIVARHGARLDAADKTWHLTSPTPYDPPLTYGGWSQAKALGQRIASLLHARGLELETANGPDADEQSRPAQTPAQPVRKRRHKIVLHSSPYLRCVQTSTAIAAGIAQFQAPPPAATVKVPQPAKDASNPPGNSPLSRTPASQASHSSAVQPASVLEPLADPNPQVFPRPHVGPDKILLRIDAFLGEWLSPDYYEDITPPPNSTMMVAGAKADLLRRGDYIELQPNANAHHTNTTKGHFPGGWVKSGAPSAVNSRRPTEDGPLPNPGSLAQALPLRERSGSQGSIASHTSRTSHRGTCSLSTAHKAPDHVYDPPVPSYAVSHSDPIPRGYVAHARDACIGMDWQWDSMRVPQEWGDGGEYGDEWSTMHKRFRRGLAGMMSWYREHGSMSPKELFPGFTFRDHAPASRPHASDPGPTANSEVDEDEELVLILVTHGAGCNALLGAITNQPVLLDVGMASLSMAVRRGISRKPSVPAMHQRQTSIVDAGMSEDYEMKMMASLDHLRPGVDPSRLPQSQSPAVVAHPSLEYHRRFTGSGGANSPVDSSFTLPETYKGLNSALGSMRRSSISGSSSSRLLSNNMGVISSPATGLWSNLRTPTTDASNEGRRSPGHDFVLNFRDQQSKPLRSTGSSTATNGNTNGNTPDQDKHNEKDEDHHGEHDDVPPLPIKKGRTLSQSTHGLWGAPKPQISQQGLWGPPRLDEVYSHTPGPKRRWTVTESEYDG